IFLAMMFHCAPGWPIRPEAGFGIGRVNGGAACSGEPCRGQGQGHARWASLAANCQCRAHHRGSRLSGLCSRPPILAKRTPEKTKACRQFRGQSGRSDHPCLSARRSHQSRFRQRISPGPWPLGDKIAAKAGELQRISDSPSPDDRHGGRIEGEAPAKIRCNLAAAARISPSFHSKSGAAGTIHP
ncbi:MAG: hypothetical protein RL472_577, partial [Pseudomonadota bacterium]